MTASRTRPFLVAILLSPCAVSAQSPSTEPPGLAGTAWRLVEFLGGDDSKLTPDDRSKYTIAFGPDASAAVRFDCNRGRGTWKSSGATLEFGPMALTRAACPPASLHDRLVRDFPLIRSYVMKDGHLFLALMADGGTYQFEPIPPTKPAGVSTPKPE